MTKKIEIVNRKARFSFDIEETYTAGMQLLGSEIKSIRLGQCVIQDGYCIFEHGELFVYNIHINEYAFANVFAHSPKRKRKLLLKKQELKRLEKKLQHKGFAIVPTKLFINEKGWAKLIVGLGKGKKIHDKRNAIKDRDMSKEMGRISKFKL